MTEGSLQSILSSGLIALLSSGIAYKCAFFKRPLFERAPIRLFHVLSVFSIYLGLPLLLQLVSLSLSSPGLIMARQFFIVISILLVLFFYMQADKEGAFQAAFKNPQSRSSRFYDFGLGMMSWLIAFPWVILMGQICDLLLYVMFNFESYEQVAVRYLRDNLQATSLMVIALISIVVLAPIIEEILFRATFQQYLKKWLSVRMSIVATSAIFASFHFSISQTLGNLSLIPSLLVFSCFLGYVYERQGSIFASIGLHCTFNLVSSLQILFFSEA